MHNLEKDILHFDAYTVPSISLGTSYILQESHYMTAIYTCVWFKYFVRRLNDNKHFSTTPTSLYLYTYKLAENMLNHHFTASKRSRLNFALWSIVVYVYCHLLCNIVLVFVIYTQII